MTNTVETAFKQHEVVPDVVPIAPHGLAKVTYEYNVEVNLGHTLTPTQVKNQPHITWETEPDSFYTVVMTDPDAPSRQDPKNREFEHWLVVNVPGNDVTEGETLAEYIGAGPPPHTGLHRYVFLVYKQPGVIKPNHDKLGFSPEQRRHWKVAKFAEELNLGTPVAGNFFQAEFDDYVPELYKKLGIGK